MTTPVFALALFGLALLLLLIAVVAQWRSRWVLALWRKPWATGQIALAEAMDFGVRGHGILGVVEDYKIEGRMWSERGAERVDRGVVFVAAGGRDHSALDLSRTRLFLNARRRYLSAYRDSMQVERMLREGEPVTLILDRPRPRSAAGEGYRAAASQALAPVAIFAGSRLATAWRLFRETAHLLGPVVLIVAMCCWAIGMELDLQRAAADSQCVE